MTQREFYVNVMNFDGITDEIKEHCEKMINKMDSTNAARATKAQEKIEERNKERAPIIAAILGVMTDEPKTATTLIEEAGVDIKPQLMPNLMKGLIAAGTVEKTSVKIKGKGSQVGYIKVTA